MSGTDLSVQAAVDQLKAVVQEGVDAAKLAVEGLRSIYESQKELEDKVARIRELLEEKKGDSQKIAGALKALADYNRKGGKDDKRSGDQ